MPRATHSIVLDETVWECLQEEHEKTKVPIARIIEDAICTKLGLKVP